jgi:uncharacterized membrane protein YGL010W
MNYFIKQLGIYDSYHTKIETRMTHFIGVPMIILALQIPLSWLYIPFASISIFSFSWIFAFLLATYYLLMDFSLGLVSALCLFLLTYLAQMIAGHHFNWGAFSAFGLLFIMGWMIQFIGHYFEGKHPAFIENLFQLIIAPAFLVAEIFFSLGYRKKLQNEIKQSKLIHISKE